MGSKLEGALETALGYSELGGGEWEGGWVGGRAVVTIVALAQMHGDAVVAHAQMCGDGKVGVVSELHLGL